MSNSRENCQNCCETFYKQSLVPLEYVDFAFGGQKITLIGCFVESSTNQTPISDGPKICRSCLELLRLSFLGNSHTLVNDGQSRKTHICATCTDYFPPSVMMSVQLTVINFDGHGVKLADCYKTCTNLELPKENSLMVCLACVSSLTNSYSNRRLDFRFEAIKVEPDYTEPSQIGESDTISEAYPNSFLEVKCKIEPELLIENLTNNDIMPETVLKPEPETVSKPSSKRTGRKRKGQTVRLAPNDEPELFKSLIDPYECSFCTKRFRLHSKLTKHLKQHRSDVLPEQKKTARNPTCPICQQVMASKYCLKRHLINSHYLYSTYRCHHCSEFKSLTKARMEEHLQLWHFETEQPCTDCSSVLPNRRAYLKHIKEHQTGKLQCPGCKRSFTKPTQYRTHLKINKTVIHCKQCNAGFHSVRARDVHMQTLHGLVFTCDVCKKPLSNRLNYNSHLRIQHSIHVKPCCKICAKEFEYTEEMVAHEMSEHATRNYICETCGQNFMDKSTMLKHITARHTDDEKVVKENCRVCGKLLKKDSMRNHIRKMHTENRVRKMPKLVYTCPQCPQWKFSRHQHLEGHMIVHNTENRQFFQCSRCGIAYTRRQKFDIHVRKCLTV